MQAFMIASCIAMYAYFLLVPPDAAATRWEVYMFPLAVVTLTLAASKMHML